MAWLIRDDLVLASLELAVSFRDRSRGLLGLDEFEGAMMLRPCKAIHTLGLQFDVDVAFCDRDLVVIDIVSMKRNRLGMTRLRANSVIEAMAGSFERWNLAIGDHLEVRY